MIAIGIDPYIFSLGPFTFTWHGVLTSLAVLSAVWIAARRGPGRGVAEEQVYSVAIWAIVGGIIGARLLHVIDWWQYYATNPMAMLAITEGGLAIYGGLLGGLFTGVAYAWLRRMPVGPLADAAAVAIPIAHIIGRVGCLINGDAHGTYTEVPWAIVYTHPGAFAPLGLPTHPFPVYEMLWNLLVVATVLILERRQLRPPGMLFPAYLGLYSVGRFFLSYFRPEAAMVAGLQQAQVIAILLVLATVPLMAFLGWRQRQAQAWRPQRRRTARR